MATSAVRALYGNLQPRERARLLARINRTEDLDELRYVRSSVPEGQEAAYNHLASILGALHVPLTTVLQVLAVGAERDNARMGMVITGVCEDLIRRHVLGELWRLIPFPVSEREHAALVAMERGRLEPLAIFAQFIVDAGADDTWRPEVLELLQEDHPTDEEWQQAALRLLQAAIADGTLPQPTIASDGPSLPWGILCDWLRYDPPIGPGLCVPLVELLGGDMYARWDIRPDAEQDAVTARRVEIARTLGYLTRLPRDTDLPGPHPAITLEELAVARAKVDAVWPATREEWCERAAWVGKRHMEDVAELAAIDQVLAESRDQDFGGEDPVGPMLATMLDTVREGHRVFDQQCTALGETLCPGVLGTPWPAPEAVSEAMQQELIESLRRTLRDME